ncbi:protein of unknown function [Pseudomonas sp. JV551A1]|uniref:Uncharacterized protein n=1 Tax=Pseudomonas inefficax TaxID=2078786 RepID=A0AAQ1SVR3_9PSED|nr:protein of unknown function [Pseudomonas sp. JV551A1]SPO62534.1 protein of unknown function [Pseudomonas inefficax]
MVRAGEAGWCCVLDMGSTVAAGVDGGEFMLDLDDDGRRLLSENLMMTSRSSTRYSTRSQPRTANR